MVWCTPHHGQRGDGLPLRGHGKASAVVPCSVQERGWQIGECPEESHGEGWDAEAQGTEAERRKLDCLPCKSDVDKEGPDCSLSLTKGGL